MPERKRFHPHQWLILITLMIGSFLGRLDATIVNLALPKIIQDFGITVSQASWISTAYIIANAVFVPVFGKLGDLLGRKPLYIYGIIGFTVSSMLAGLSFNLPSMVIFRIIQAITVSIDYPIALSIIAYTFEDRTQRSTAMGIWSAVFAASAVFGPLIGGPLVDNFSWRSVFYINIPLGLIGILMAMRFIEEPVKQIKGIANFDILGAFFLGVCLGTLVLVLDQGQSWGWTSGKSWISYIVSAISLAAFLFVEKKAKEPVVDLSFFAIRTFTAAITTSFISFMGLFGALFLLPLFAQNQLGYSVTKSGLLFVPMAIGIMFSAQFGARLAIKFPPRLIVSLGMLTAGLGTFLFSFIDPKWSAFDLVWRLFILAVGLGLGLAPLTSSVTNSVKLEEVGIASSILALARNIAGAFGVAIFATILSNGITHSLIVIGQNTIVHTTNPTLLHGILQLIVQKANVQAYGLVFYWASVSMVLGAISALFLSSPKAADVKKPQEEMAPVEI